MAAFDTLVENRALGSISDERFENYLNFSKQFIESPGGQKWHALGVYKISEAGKQALQIGR